MGGTRVYVPRSSVTLIYLVIFPTRIVQSFFHLIPTFRGISSVDISDIGEIISGRAPTRADWSIRSL